MAIERDLIFANGTAYRLFLTMDNLTTLSDYFHEEGDMQRSMFCERALSTLSDLRFTMFVEMDDFICDCITGIETPLDIWFDKFGYVAETLTVDDSTIATYELTTEEWSVCTDQEAIDDDVEAELVIGAHILLELNDEVIDLTDYDESEGSI